MWCSAVIETIVVGGAALRLLDHRHRAVDGVDLRAPHGEPGRERSGAAADVQHPPAALRQPPEQDPLVVGVVIPLVHGRTPGHGLAGSPRTFALPSTSTSPPGRTQRTAGALT
jgi:hypothetical protein